MKKELEETTLHLTGVFVIPELMPECLRILESISKPILSRSLVKEGGIVIQGTIVNTIDYVYLCPLERIEKSQRFKRKINFARFMEIRNLGEYSAIHLRANLEWKEFVLINPRSIRFSQIIGVNPIGTLRGMN